ncbi:hypothetical protein [Alicyclobacillus fastidiosus]|uniref:Uncharacterized protein n=1 Tax=Alicyclobacillus fastidiosus TaxID=392011 RepID=A0ABV5AKC1_9BACL|nr:hypothetical protein [Alicyclobacillus fastidiosus]WEH08464.1 hypothetical protein PYS47_17475 [Alicyclobacillus fastidiosus]
MSKVVKEHIQKHTITEYEHIPEHDERRETLEFKNSKHELESIEHLGCFICGTMNYRESHHIIERSDANGSDLKKVAFLLFHFRDYHGHCHRDFKSADELYAFLSKFETPELALDTLYNQLILCADHHRGMSIGIHGMSAPMFDAWLVRKDGWEPTFTLNEAQKWLSSHEGK